MLWELIQKRSCILSPILAPLSLLYRFGAELRKRLIRPDTLPVPVISIGNIVLGGTGKTPACIMLCRWAKEEGYNPSVVLRGYGGKFHGRVGIVSDGKRIIMSAKEAGDEACLLSENLKGVPVIISKNRHLGAKLSLKRFNTDLFLLDDGFQHISLKRSLDIVLIDSRDPFGNRRLIPWGPLREPIDSLKRADIILLTRADKSEKVKGLKRYITERFKKPVFLAQHIPEDIVFPYLRERISLDDLRGKKVVAFAGIAKGMEFIETLRSLDIDVSHFILLRDHSFYSPRQVDLFEKERIMHEADLIITTEKDWMRIKDMNIRYPELGYLRIRFEIVSDKSLFFNMIRERIKKAYD